MNGSGHNRRDFLQRSAGIVAVGSVVPYWLTAQGIDCIQLLKKHNWDGILCIEADGSQNVQSSIKWLRGQLGQ